MCLSIEQYERLAAAHGLPTFEQLDRLARDEFSVKGWITDSRNHGSLDDPFMITHVYVGDAEAWRCGTSHLPHVSIGGEEVQPCDTEPSPTESPYAANLA